MPRLPTLTTAGWVNDLVTVSTSMMDYFLVSEHSQTQFYPGNVSSLPYLIQQHGSEPDRLADRARDVLQQYFSRYFDATTSDVVATRLNGNNGRYDLTIDVAVMKNGKQHRLGRLIEVGDSKIIQVKDKFAE